MNDPELQDEYDVINQSIITDSPDSRILEVIFEHSETREQQVVVTAAIDEYDSLEDCDKWSVTVDGQIVDESIADEFIGEHVNEVNSAMERELELESE